MKKMYIHIYIIPLFSLMLSCSKQEKTPPLLPPYESVLLDLSFFNMTEEITYYNDASELISYWQIMLNDSFALQKKLLETALNNELTYQDKETWLIYDNLTYNDELYDILLFCIDDADTIVTKLFISFITAEDTITNQLSFDGKSYNTNSKGEWTINKTDTAAELNYVKFLAVKWDIDEFSNKNMRFTNSLSGGDNGNFLLYKDSVDGIYDSYIQIFNKGQDNQIYIKWNRTNKYGRIRDELKYNDTMWRCWDENFNNIECNK